MIYTLLHIVTLSLLVCEQMVILHPKRFVSFPRITTFPLHTLSLHLASQGSFKANRQIPSVICNSQPVLFDLVCPTTSLLLAGPLKILSRLSYPVRMHHFIYDVYFRLICFRWCNIGEAIRLRLDPLPQSANYFSPPRPCVLTSSWFMFRLIRNCCCSL